MSGILFLIVFDIFVCLCGVWRGFIILIVVVVVMVVMCLLVIGIGVDFLVIVWNWQNGVDKIVKLFLFDWSFFFCIVVFFIEMLQMVVIVIVIGVVVLLLFSFWVVCVINFYILVCIVVCGIFNVICSVFDLLYVVILVVMVGVGVFFGIFVLLLFNVGIIVKFVFEVIDINDCGFFEVGCVVGVMQVKINCMFVLFDVWLVFVNQMFYVFELNVCVLIVFGFVGVGGMGLLIDVVCIFY